MKFQKSRRVLWKNQEIEDNHTDDDTFLKELRTNVNLKMYSYLDAVHGSAVLVHHICLVVLFVLIYAFVYQNLISATQIITFFSGLLGICHSYYRSLIASDLVAPLETDLRTFVVIYGFAFGISPILSTLTKTVSTDTIYSMVVGLLLANLAVHDYGPRAVVVSQAFSLNTAFGAAVCLASRLPSSLDAFALAISAVGIFGLWPSMRSALKLKKPTMFLILTLVLLVIDCVLILQLSLFFAALFAGLVFIVGLLCPALLVYLQRFKTTIHGPWDEAVIKCSTPPPNDSGR